VVGLGQSTHAKTEPSAKLVGPVRYVFMAQASGCCGTYTRIIDAVPRADVSFCGTNILDWFNISNHVELLLDTDITTLLYVRPAASDAYSKNLIDPTVVVAPKSHTHPAVSQ
jgi:hypothetical protein